MDSRCSGRALPPALTCRRCAASRPDKF